MCLIVFVSGFKPVDFLVLCFVKQKTAYEMRISDWSSDVCSSDLPTIAWQLVDHPARECYDLSSLVSVGYGGATSAPDLVRLIHQHLGAMPGTGWGMTETTGTVLSPTAEEYMRAPTSRGPPGPIAEVQTMRPAGQSKAGPGEGGSGRAV